MEFLTELLAKFGIELELLGTLCVAVLLIVNAVKDKIPIIVGYWTQVLTLVIAFGLSVMVYSQDVHGIDWLAVIITTFICWLGPDSFNSWINRKVHKAKP